MVRTLARLVVEDLPTRSLLDEPFDALDSDGITRVNTLPRERTQRGGSVLLTSHVSVYPERQPIELDLGGADLGLRAVRYDAESP